MPVPPPLPAPAVRSRRRLRRWRAHAAEREFLRGLVLSLNLLTGSRRREAAQPSPETRATEEQQRHLVRLGRGCRRFARLGRTPGRELGRFWPKATDLHQELAALERDFGSLALELDGYSAPGRDSTAASGPAGPEPNTGGASSSDGDLPPPPAEPRRDRKTGTVVCDLVASRVKWARGPSFDPRPYLSDLELAAAYDDPEVLQLAGRRPAHPAGKIHAAPSEFASFLKKWDAVGSLLLLPARASPKALRCGAFGVPKDADSERFIINPMAVNSTMRRVSRWCSSLSPGALLCSLVLRPGRGVLINSDDLRDFYHSFAVNPVRARRNAFNVVFPASTFEGFAAWRPELAGLDVVPCLNTLGMGDSLAVEIAQASHLGLLRACGAGRPEHFVRYGAPFPRGPLYELLAIDDHVVLEDVALNSFPSRAAADDSIDDLVLSVGGAPRPPG